MTRGSTEVPPSQQLTSLAFVSVVVGSALAGKGRVARLCT
jgi:hypothetical protein